MRRSLFDVIQHSVADGTWLDLYAGSGSFGLEALSRGAERVLFVESARAGLECLRRNLALLDLGSPVAELLTRPLPGCLHRAPPAAAPFRFVSMDPPFAVSRDPERLAGLCQGLNTAGGLGWFSGETTLLWEEPSDAPAPVPGGFRETDVRSYGTSRVRFFRWHGDAP